MPPQQTQGVQIHGRTADDVVTLTSEGAKSRLDTAATIVDGDGHSLLINEDGSLNVNSAPPVGGATAAKQDEQTALITTLSTLVETLQELVGRLAPIAGAMQLQGGHALRVAPISSVSTAVTGSLTTVTNLTNFGTATPAKKVADDMNNLVAVMANSNNATAV